ncbi:MAG: hypothetical protein NZ898_15185 [Myxococcota bacterium]|nr:hypothetical protein [Myxococcota bacterium]
MNVDWQIWTGQPHWIRVRREGDLLTVTLDDRRVATLIASAPGSRRGVHHLHIDGRTFELRWLWRRPEADVDAMIVVEGNQMLAHGGDRAACEHLLDPRRPLPEPPRGIVPGAMGPSVPMAPSASGTPQAPSAVSSPAPGDDVAAWRAQALGLQPTLVASAEALTAVEPSGPTARGNPAFGVRATSGHGAWGERVATAGGLRDEGTTQRGVGAVGPQPAAPSTGPMEQPPTWLAPRAANARSDTPPTTHDPIGDAPTIAVSMPGEPTTRPAAVLPPTRAVPAHEQAAMLAPSVPAVVVPAPAGPSSLQAATSTVRERPQHGGSWNATADATRGAGRPRRRSAGLVVFLLVIALLAGCVLSVVAVVGFLRMGSVTAPEPRPEPRATPVVLLDTEVAVSSTQYSTWRFTLDDIRDVELSFESRGGGLVAAYVMPESELDAFIAATRSGDGTFTHYHALAAEGLATHRASTTLPAGAFVLAVTAVPPPSTGFATATVRLRLEAR